MYRIPPLKASYYVLLTPPDLVVKSVGKSGEYLRKLGSMPARIYFSLSFSQCRRKLQATFPSHPPMPISEKRPWRSEDNYSRNYTSMLYSLPFRFNKLGNIGHCQINEAEEEGEGKENCGGKCSRHARPQVQATHGREA